VPSKNPIPPDEGFNEAASESGMDVAKIHDAILHEKSEPCAGNEPVSLWLIVVFFALIFWAGLYLGNNSGGFRADAFGPAGAGTPVVAGPVDPMVLGKQVFTKNCIVCHQATGLGVPPAFPALAGSEWVLSGDWHGDNHLVKIVLHGLQGPVQVKGATYNGAMPPWHQLKDEQIAAVLTYIRAEWGNAACPVPIDYVKTMREQSASRTEPWTQKDLQAIPPEKISQ